MLSNQQILIGPMVTDDDMPTRYLDFPKRLYQWTAELWRKKKKSDLTSIGLFGAVIWNTRSWKRYSGTGKYIHRYSRTSPEDRRSRANFCRKEIWRTNFRPLSRLCTYVASIHNMFPPRVTSLCHRVLRSIFGFEQSILTPLPSSPPWPLSRRNILVMLHNFFTTQALADLKADTAESTEDGTFSSKHFASQITKGQQPSFVIGIRRGNMVAEATGSTPLRHIQSQ